MARRGALIPAQPRAGPALGGGLPFDGPAGFHLPGSLGGPFASGAVRVIARVNGNAEATWAEAPPPFAWQIGQASEATTYHPQMSGSRPRILIVDDDAACRAVLDALLSEDYEVEQAANGQEALDRCAEHEPDLIVLDLDMPVVDGREFVERRRAAGSPLTPIIVVSALSEARTTALELAARGIIPKPFNVDEVSRTVAGVLRHGPPTPGGD